MIARMGLFVWIILTSLFSTCRPSTNRSLLTRHNTLLLWQIARDLLHALSHRHDNTWHSLCWTSHQHWWEQVNSTLVGYHHLCKTNRSCQAWTWTASLDRDLNHCAISSPPHIWASDWKVGCLPHLCSVPFDNSLAIYMSPTCSSQVHQLIPHVSCVIMSVIMPIKVPSYLL